MAIYFGIAGGSKKGPPTVTIAPGGAAGSAKAPAYGYLGPFGGGGNGLFLSPPASPPSPPSPPGPNWTVNASVAGGGGTVTVAVGQTKRVAISITVNNSVSVPGTPPFSCGIGGGSGSHHNGSFGPITSTGSLTATTYVDITGTSPGSELQSVLPSATDAGGVNRGYANGAAGNAGFTVVTTS